MTACECPLCDAVINLDTYKENDFIHCDACGARLELVALVPPVLEEVPDDEENWE